MFIDRRKTKNVANHLGKKLPVGAFFIGCNNAPCRVTVSFWHPRFPYDSYVEGVSLIDGTTTSCSLVQCSPTPISEQKAREMVEFAKTHTWTDYLIKFRYGPFPSKEAENLFITEYHKMADIWGWKK